MTSTPRDGAVIEAVIFDWGGTLAHWAFVGGELTDMWRLAARHLAQHMEADEDTIHARLNAVERAMWDRTETDARSATLSELLSEATTALGADVAQAILEEAGTHYLDTWTPHIRHKEEAVEALTALRARGLRIGLLSNTHWPPAYHERFLERDGLDVLIDARLYTSEMPFMKPHPEAFRRALEAVGVEDPSRAVFVGDRQFDDIFGAQRAGMRTVLIPNAMVPPYDAEPDARIESLAELPGLIDGWRRAP